MTPAVGSESNLQYETIDVNIVPDLYVTWIVDLWQGEKTDPATAITRYIGVWRAEVLENEKGEAIDPVFSEKMLGAYNALRYISPTPMHWQALESIKEADSEAQNFRSQMEDALRPRERFDYNRREHIEERSPMEEFMDAIDRLAVDDTDQEAWAIVQARRKAQIEKMER